jgi:general secretion pathway protein E
MGNPLVGSDSDARHGLGHWFGGGADVHAHLSACRKRTMNTALDSRLLAQPYSATELAAARLQARARGCRLIEALEGEGGSEHTFAMRLAATVQMRCLDVVEMHTMEPVFEMLPYSEALTHECLLLRGANQQLVLVIADPFDLDLRAWASERLDVMVDLCVAHQGDIAAFFTRHEETLRAMDGIVSAQQSSLQGSMAEDISLRSISEDTSPVVRLVNSTLYDALKAGASDIHMETAPNGLFIKYRIDGVLAHIGGNHGMDHAEQIISRIKVMAELDIAERRVPQDGRFKVAANGREIDIRVSIMPSIHGEDAVLRILDKQSLSDQVVGLRLEVLGFDTQTLKALRALSEEPYGMLLANW